MHHAFHPGGWGRVPIASALGLRGDPDVQRPEEPLFRLPGGPTGTEATRWFAAVKPYGDALEAEPRIAADPAPAGRDGAGSRAACFALAGPIERAREILDGMERDSARFLAAHAVDDGRRGNALEILDRLERGH